MKSNLSEAATCFANPALDSIRPTFGEIRDLCRFPKPRTFKQGLPPGARVHLPGFFSQISSELPAVKGNVFRNYPAEVGNFDKHGGINEVARKQVFKILLVSLPSLPDIIRVL